MAMKFDRAERKALDGHTAKLKALYEEILAKVQEYNEEAENFTTTRDEAADRIQGEWDEKSERWQEGDKGEAVSAWLEEVREVEITPIELDEQESELEALEGMNYGPMQD